MPFYSILIDDSVLRVLPQKMFKIRSMFLAAALLSFRMRLPEKN